MEHHFRNRGSICALCNGEIQDPISKPCGHSFCFSCFFKNRALRGNVGGSCPACISYIEIDQALQLISVNENGLLHLNEAALLRCFLREGIEEYPVYLISVIGERRTGKSFLMNYIMKALQNQEKNNAFGLGAKDEILKGFNWKPGTDTVTNGICIWSKPFVLEQNGQKIAVFLVDMEGSMDINVERKANIKMCMLTMLLSSHLVYNVNSNIKETDIDYLEIYCHGLGSDKLHNLKYFDFLIRNWYDLKCEPKDGELYFDSIIETMKKRYKNCTFLEVLAQCSSSCFLMPHPGNTITSEATGRLTDMNKEFQESLRRYLSDVVDRVMRSIGSADSENTLTCSDMAQKIITEFLPNINDLNYNITSPSEMYNMKKNLETMQEIKYEFQVFLRTWPMWKLKIGNQVGDKISELYQKFQSAYKYTNDEDRNEQLENLKTYLVTEGENFCKNHNVTLCLHGITAVAGLAAFPLTGVFAAAPAAAAASAFSFQSILGWTWFGAKAAAPAAASSISATSIIGGVTAATQVGVAYVGKYITNRGVTVAKDDPSTPSSPRCASSDTHSGKMD